jgi:hypothetical protein
MGVDTSPIKAEGAARPIEKDSKKVVTSGDIAKLFKAA